MPWHQPSLKEVILGKAHKPETPVANETGDKDAPVVEVYDFFAGAGGFSTGAAQAGCRVVWACDNDPLALETHKRNHPETEHCLAELPLKRNEWPFPTDGRPFHAHFSPPCQKFSDVNQTHRVKGDRRVAESLVEWSLETALTCGAQTWSLEQVPNAAVVAIVEAAKRRHPGRVAYARVDFSHLGVPQTRKRLIAGSPVLVAQLLRRLDRANLTTVRSAITKPRGTHVRNGKGWISKKRGADGRWLYTKAGWGDCCHTIDEPAPTVLAHRELSWVTRREGGYDHGHLRPNEMAALQTFPPTYSWPDSLKRCLIEIGNAVPPLVSRLLLAPLATSSRNRRPRLRQPSLLEVLRGASPPLQPSAQPPLEVYDFFAGAGGFSTGARQAGCRVVYACDNNAEALATHKRNHPETEHACLTLPSAEAVAKLPTDGRRFHVHCSPPCVKLSRINTPNVVAGNEGSRGMHEAADMVEWCLEMMLASKCTSWSLEQVGDHTVQTIVERVRKRYPTRLAYAVIKLEELGIPQTRVRLIAATPTLLAALLRKACKANVRTTRDVIAKPRGTHVRSGRSIVQVRKRLNRKKGETMWINARAGWEDWCTSIDRPAPTVRARHTHAWVTLKDGKATHHCRMSAQDLAALQTFPPDYQLPERKQEACLQVGNAVPPLLAQRLLESVV